MLLLQVLPKIITMTQSRKAPTTLALQLVYRVYFLKAQIHVGSYLKHMQYGFSTLLDLRCGSR